MSSWFVLSVIALICFGIERSQAKSCHILPTSAFTRNTCATFQNPYQVCDSVTTSDTYGTCIDMTERTTLGSGVGTLNPNRQNILYCSKTTEGKKMLALDNVCKQFGAQGCTYRATMRCSNLSPYKNVDGVTQCVEKDITIGGHRYRELEEDCGNNSTHVCGANLVCNSQRMCEKASTKGKDCGGDYDGCINGLVCEDRKCVTKHSKEDNEPCFEHAACRSNFCNPQSLTCTSKLVSRPCYRSSECRNAVNDAICSNADESNTKKIQGVCNNGYRRTAYDIANCMRKYCTKALGESGYDKDCKYKKCEKWLVKDQCAKYCGNRPDLRWNLNSEYNYDCKSFKLTAWSSMGVDSKCSIGEQFTNCDAYLEYTGSAGRLSFNVALFFVALIGTLAMI